MEQQQDIWAGMGGSDPAENGPDWIPCWFCGESEEQQWHIPGQPRFIHLWEPDPTEPR